MEHHSATRRRSPRRVAIRQRRPRRLPNTVQGMGWRSQAPRQIRTERLLAITRQLASGVEMRPTSEHGHASTEADAVVAFINKAGLVGNPAGVTPWTDITNVADHDAAWYGPPQTLTVGRTTCRFRTSRAARIHDGCTPTPASHSSNGRCAVATILRTDEQHQRATTRTTELILHRAPDAVLAAGSFRPVRRPTPTRRTME